MIATIVVPEFGMYSVTQSGEVYRLKNKKLSKVNTFKDRNGYVKVMAYNDSGKRKRVSVHRLVYSAFYRDLSDSLSIDHLDGDKQNNKPENLEQVTFAENYSRFTKMNTIKAHNRKLSVTQASEARGLRVAGMSFQKIADRYGVHWSTIHAIVNKNYYKEAP